MRLLVRVLREFLETVLPAILLALFINTFLAQATVVRGQSMEPTLHDNQRVIVEKLSYRLFGGPHRGDIVVLTVPGNPDRLIKRVVALGGETVAIQDGQILIDGIPLAESWAVRWGGPDYPPTPVPEGYVFVLGDNRGHSNDSRSFGPVPVQNIVGRAVFIYWPLSEVGLVR
ncbi:MAG: signal peptidase I [Anaerolineae bacterium]|nr:signal peptidase I [Anaerolineae bacterium]MCX8066694.1 signal peptidase I [Anaerolineae bacterium]MDW7993009.1 signal peptidase I [Anaerolineae bacterium]